MTHDKAEHAQKVLPIVVEALENLVHNHAPLPGVSYLWDEAREAIRLAKGEA
tara:strand:+ start:82 stop:237 length:156 start_codon:yes stop_codon:yes gene_type:complete